MITKSKARATFASGIVALALLAGCSSSKSADTTVAADTTEATETVADTTSADTKPVDASTADTAAAETTAAAADAAPAAGGTVQTAGIYDCGPADNGTVYNYLKFTGNGELFFSLIEGATPDTVNEVRKYLGIDLDRVPAGNYTLDGSKVTGDTLKGATLEAEFLEDGTLSGAMTSTVNGFVQKINCAYSAD